MNQWLLTLVYTHVLQAFLFSQLFKTQCVQKQPSHMRRTEQNTKTWIAKAQHTNIPKVTIILTLTVIV